MDNKQLTDRLISQRKTFEGILADLNSRLSFINNPSIQNDISQANSSIRTIASDILNVQAIPPGTMGIPILQQYYFKSTMYDATIKTIQANLLTYIKPPDVLPPQKQIITQDVSPVNTNPPPSPVITPPPNPPPVIPITQKPIFIVSAVIGSILLLGIAIIIIITLKKR